MLSKSIINFVILKCKCISVVIQNIFFYPISVDFLFTLWYHQVILHFLFSWFRDSHVGVFCKRSTLKCFEKLTGRHWNCRLIRLFRLGFSLTVYIVLACVFFPVWMFRPFKYILFSPWRHDLLSPYYTKSISREKCVEEYRTGKSEDW